MQRVRRADRRLRVLVFVTVTVLSREASADKETAAAHFKEGAAAYAKSDYRTAAGLFERAYTEAPRGAAIYNAGLAWEAAGEVARAADAYAKALGSSDLDTRSAEGARARLESIEQRVGWVDLSAFDGTVSVGHVEGARPPIKVHLTPGTYRVRALSSRGTSQERSVTVSPAVGSTVALDADPPPAPPTVAAAMREAPAPPRRDPTVPRSAGFVLLGCAGAASVAAGVLGLSALSAKDDFDASGHRDADARERASTQRTWTNIAWVGAALLGGSGVYILVAQPRARSRKVTAMLGPRGLAFSTRF
jgi:hypothetical protein